MKCNQTTKIAWKAGKQLESVYVGPQMWRDSKCHSQDLKCCISTGGFRVCIQHLLFSCACGQEWGTSESTYFQCNLIVFSGALKLLTWALCCHQDAESSWSLVLSLGCYLAPRIREYQSKLPWFMNSKEGVNVTFGKCRDFGLDYWLFSASLVANVELVVTQKHLFSYKFTYWNVRT